MKRLTVTSLALVLLTLLGLGTAQDAPASLDPVVIQVGDTTETLSNFNQRFEIALRNVAAQQGVGLDATTRAQFEGFKPVFLDQRATELALLGEAQARGVTVPDEDVDARVAEARQNFDSDEAFSEALQSAGFADEAQLRQIIQETDTIQAVVDALREEVEVSDADVEAYYNENQAQFESPEQVCARHILVATEEEAQSISQELEGGADFATLAQERSTDTGSGAQGGDLGCFTQDRMVAPFAEAAFGAPVDEVVGPVQTQFGYHLIKVYERRPAGAQPLSEVQEGVRQQLQEQGLSDEITALRETYNVQTFPENLGVSETGGAATGGAVTGGADDVAITGGDVTGGAMTGGAMTGGDATGGAATGGAMTGGTDVTGGAGVTGGTGGQ